MPAKLCLRYTASRRTGCHVQKHDVGDGEMLTTRQIAARIGGTPHTVRGRLAKGWTGEQLLQPLRERRKLGQPKGLTPVIACKLALTFGWKAPTAAQIMDIHPMEESTAAYWANAYKHAIAQLHDRVDKDIRRRRNGWQP